MVRRKYLAKRAVIMAKIVVRESVIFAASCLEYKNYLDLFFKIQLMKKMHSFFFCYMPLTNKKKKSFNN